MIVCIEDAICGRKAAGFIFVKAYKGVSWCSIAQSCPEHIYVWAHTSKSTHTVLCCQKHL